MKFKKRKIDCFVFVHFRQLAQNHKKMFNISNNNQSGDLHGIQQKFLLIK